MTTTGVTELALQREKGTLKPVTTIDDLFPATCGCVGSPLEQAIADGYVRRQIHPSEPLAILNYTEACAYEGAWTPVTLACRGLIYRTDTGEVVARGFTKFFNHGQAGAAEIPLTAPVHVTDKADGSLGIIYPLPSGGWAVSTRGSFTSEQAVHATALLGERYAGFEPKAGVTTLVEIVYPANRIVLDYAGLDDLILLGGVEIATGEVFDATFFPAWTGPVTATFEAATLAEALAMEPRPNAEGVVVRSLATGAMLKIKQADYVELHRIVTNLTARKVHEWLVAGKPIAEFIAPLPDEFHAWCLQIADGIRGTVREQGYELVELYEDAVDAVISANPWWRDRAARTTRDGRKAYAAVATSPAYRDHSWALFALLDDRNIYPELLKRARPAPYLTPTGRTYSEETA